MHHNRKYCVENESDRPLGNKNDFELRSMSVFSIRRGEMSAGNNVDAAAVAVELRYFQPELSTSWGRLRLRSSSWWK